MGYLFGLFLLSSRDSQAVTDGIWAFVMQFSIGLIVFAICASILTFIASLLYAGTLSVGHKLGEWRDRIDFRKYMGLT